MGNVKKEPYKEDGPWQCGYCTDIINSVHDRHNGEPLVSDWVCTQCNGLMVIPMRLGRIRAAEKVPMQH
jgi:hypothetical protein